MKHLLIFYLILFTHPFLYAQNLVPNYSFEQADSCPTFLNDRSFEYSLGCVGWGQATTAYAEYFNACDTAAISIGRNSPWVGVPYNFIGHQSAYEGVAYVGINMYSPSLPNYKVYLFANIPILEIDTAYQVTIHISLADSCEFATDGFGVLFTTYGSPNQFIDTTLGLKPQIDYTSYGVITDSINWTTLKGTFVADSAYSTLIIGGFKTLSEMKIIAVNDSPSNPHNNSFYYLDNVVVEKLSSTGFGSITNYDFNPVLYPNPFTDHATIIFSNQDQKNCSLTIFNSQGQVVKRIDNINSDRIRIERNGLPSGFYYYQLRNTNNIVANGKFIIK